MPLTDVQLRTAKPGTRTIKLSDGGGLQLWVTPGGSKLWNLAYRWNHKQRKLSLGRYPTIGLKVARQQRDDAKRLLASGVDPALNRKMENIARSDRAKNTFGIIADEVLAKKRREGLSEPTLKKVEWLLGIACASLANRPIQEVSSPEILGVLRTVEGAGKHETAKRLRSTIGECFRYAIATGRASADPTYALRGALAAPKVTHRPAITNHRDVGRLLRAIDGYHGSVQVRVALKLAALVFLRPKELRLANWDDIDLERGIWSIPATTMKMRRAHQIPLSLQTVAALEEVKIVTGGRGLVFPSVRSLLRPLSENTLNAALRSLGFDKYEMCTHGFRAIASTMLNESGK